MKQEPCKFADLGCTQMISFIIVKLSEKRMPVHAEPVQRVEGTELPKGMYYTLEGVGYKQDTAPLGVDLYVPHWGHCPGAEKARKK